LDSRASSRSSCSFPPRFERGRLLFDLVEFAAQRLVSRARLVEHTGQAERLRLFLLERAQRRVERRDDLVEGFLEFVEFADLAAGVGQQVAQNFVSSPMREPTSEKFSTLM